MLFQAKDIYQGNPVWASAGVAQAMHDSQWTDVPTGHGKMENALVDVSWLLILALNHRVIKPSFISHGVPTDIPQQCNEAV